VDFPAYFKSLSIRKAVPAEVAASEPWTAELAEAYLRPLGIRSMLDAGIFVEDRLVGVVCHEHIGPPREWTTEARDYAGHVADLLALRIQSAEVRQLRAAFQKQANRLAALDKAEALERMAAGLAHDLRNLLTVFLGQGEVLSVRRDVPEDVRRQGKEVVAAAERGLRMAEDLLAFARPRERPPVVVDAAELTASQMPTLRAAAGPAHELRLSTSSEVGRVLIDAEQYGRLLFNLVVNAREAMPKGGLIDLRLSRVRLSGDPQRAGRYVLVEVADHGHGMSNEVKRKAFDPYFTTKESGTGLGLAVVRQVVDRAGGIIRIDDTPGGGTTVRVFLPRIGASSITGGTGVLEIPPELQSAD
jgi:signal transduction histidine kinase